MPEIHEMLAEWDGQSDPSQELIDHLKTLGGQIPDDQKLRDYLLGDESNQQVS